MGGDRFGKLLDQRTELADLRGERVGHRPRPVEGGFDLAFHGGETPPKLGHLAGELGHAVRQVGELPADRRSKADAGRDHVVEGERRQGGDTEGGGLGSADAQIEIEGRAGRPRDDHHADRDKDGTKTHHGGPIEGGPACALCPANRAARLAHLHSANRASPTCAFTDLGIHRLGHLHSTSRASPICGQCDSLTTSQPP